MNARPYTLRQEQLVPRPIEEVFAFFSDAHNLEAITPPWVGFHVMSVRPPVLSAGTEIRYRFKLHGIPLYWKTEILHWNPPFGFVDIERIGPYKLWHHTHKFKAEADGTRMFDIVRYTLPFGVLGRMVHALKVKGDVEKIFAYRRRQIDAMFPNR